MFINDVVDLWTRNTIRLQIAFLLSAAMMTCGLLRGHLAMALVCMMKSDLNSTSDEETYTVRHHLRKIIFIKFYFRVTRNVILSIL